MTDPKLILDANVLRNKQFLRWIKMNYRGKVTVSPIAYTENLRQLYANRCDPKVLEKMLDDAKVTIGIFGKKEAIAAAEIMNNQIKVCECCHNIDWADTMIYSSIWNPPTVLVTDNVSDFPANDRVMTPIMVVRRYGRSDDT